MAFCYSRPSKQTTVGKEKKSPNSHLQTKVTAAETLFGTGLRTVTDIGLVNEAGTSSLPGGAGGRWLCLPGTRLLVCSPHTTLSTSFLSLTDTGLKRLHNANPHTPSKQDT